MKTLRIVMILLCFSLFFSGCSGRPREGGTQNEGLYISTMSGSIGAVESGSNSFERQRYRYTIYLQNDEDYDVYLKSVEPVYSQEFERLIEGGSGILDISKALERGKSIEITGEVVFRSEGMSKEQIVDLEPFVTGFRITEERTVKPPGRRQ